MDTFVNVPSYTVKASDIVGVSERSQNLLKAITNSLASARYNKYSWLEWDQDQMAGKFLNMPERSDIPENIKEQLIVELYSK
jgi:small subunit ribosomal protein S4